MTDAIIASTQESGKIPFSHVGIVEKTSTGFQVIEAIDTSVRCTPLDEFLHRSAQYNNQPIVAVGRLRDVDKTLVHEALCRAHACIGQPYDDDFLPDNDKYYCSELVWHCYRATDDTTHLLQSYPMNFRAADGSMPAYWISHFANLGMEVPEGVRGTNPMDMSHDPRVEIVYTFYTSER
jgi:uncharacterized protein YycO